MSFGIFASKMNYLLYAWENATNKHDTQRRGSISLKLDFSSSVRNLERAFSTAVHRYVFRKWLWKSTSWNFTPSLSLDIPLFKRAVSQLSPVREISKAFALSIPSVFGTSLKKLDCLWLRLHANVSSFTEGPVQMLANHCLRSIHYRMKDIHMAPMQ